MKHARSDYDRIQDPAGIIPEDEPVFIIRGQDLLGPEILRKYAYAARRVGAEDDIIQAVLDHAEAMEEWQLEHVVKVPDL